jgi:hypothetical protein
MIANLEEREWEFIAYAEARYGLPKVKPSAGHWVPMGHFNRRAWVWFPSGVNHGVRVDHFGSHITVEVWRHAGKETPSGNASLTQTMMPGRDEMEALMDLAWGPATGPFHCLICHAGGARGHVPNTGHSAGCPEC